MTSDATGGTAFDVTGVSDLETLRNANSSEDLTLTGIDSLVGVELHQNGSAGVGANDPTPDTTLVFDAAVVAGADDALDVSLDSNLNVDGTPVGNLTAQGVETFNLTTTGGASQIAALISGSLETVNVEGDQDLTITNNLVGATTVDANTFTGDLSVVVDSGAQDVVVTGGDGNDIADFSNGFDAGDEFIGGDGLDTIVMGNAAAAAAAGTLTMDVETLRISDADGMARTIDMDNFAGVETVVYAMGLGNNQTVDDAVSGLIVDVASDPTVPFAPLGNDLTVDLKTDGADDELTINLDAHDSGGGGLVGTLTADDAETLNINVEDKDGATAAAGDASMTIANLAAGDMTTLNLSGDGSNVTIANTVDPATPVLSTIDASSATGDVTISGTNTASGGATITLGDGDDTFNVATSNGADTFTLGEGDDTLVYTAAAQSSGLTSDTVTDFTRGEDVIDVTGLGTITSSLFLGNATNTTAAETALTGSAGEAVFVQSDNVLLVDVNGDGNVGAADLRVKLDGITELDAADLGLGTGVTFTANTVAFDTAVAGDSVENNAVTQEDDIINATVAQLPGSTVNGLLGTDTLNVEGTAAPGEVADLTGTFDNVEIVNIDSSVEGVSVDNSDFAAGGGDITTINGDAGTIQGLTVNNTSDLTDTAINNIQALNQTGIVTMSVAQHNGFGAINAGGAGDQITLDDAGILIGDADIETYALANGNNDFTVGTPGQNVTENGGSNTVQIGGQAITGNYNTFEGDDTLVATSGANLTGANTGNTLGFGTLNLAGGIVMFDNQHTFNDIVASGASDSVTIASENVMIDITTDVDVETYTIEEETSGVSFTVNISGADQTIDRSVDTGIGGFDNTTFDFVTTGTVFTGTINGESTGAADNLQLDNGDDISGGNISGVVDLNIANNASVTMTAAQYNGFTGNVTAGGTETVTLTTSGTIAVDADIENYVLNGAGDDTVMINESNDGTLNDSVRGNMSVDLAGGGNDTVVIDNLNVNDGNDSSVDISNFMTGGGPDGDTLQLSVGGTSTSDGTFSNDYDGSGITVTDGDIIEIDANQFQFGTASNTGTVLNWLNSNGVGTQGGNPDTVTVVAYDGAGQAAIYQAADTDGGTFFNNDLDDIELIGTVDAADNSFVGADFA